MRWHWEENHQLHQLKAICTYFDRLVKYLLCSAAMRKRESRIIQTGRSPCGTVPPTIRQHTRADAVPAGDHGSGGISPSAMRQIHGVISGLAAIISFRASS